MTPNQIAAVGGRIVGSYLHGSIAYGTDHINSEKCTRHIFIQTKQTVLADRYLPSVFIEPDTAYYEIQFYLQRLWKGDYGFIDLLHSPVDCVIFEGSVIRPLQNMSNLFKHKGTVQSMVNKIMNNIVYTDSCQSLDDMEARKMLSEAQRLLWKATSVTEGVWYVREPEYRAEQLKKIESGAESQGVMEYRKKDVKKLAENLLDSKLFRNLPPQPYMSEYHNTLLKIREGRL